MKREKMLFLSIVWLLVLTNWNDVSKLLGWGVVIYGLPWNVFIRKIRMVPKAITIILAALALAFIAVGTVHADGTPTLPVCTPVLTTPTWIYTPLPVGTYGPQSTNTPVPPLPSMTPICVNGICSTQTMTPTPTLTPTPTITPTPGVGYYWELVIPQHEIAARQGTAPGEYWGTVYSFVAHPDAKAVVFTAGKRCTGANNDWAKGRAIVNGNWNNLFNEQGCNYYGQWWQAQSGVPLDYGYVSNLVNQKFPGIGGTSWWNTWGITGFGFQLGYSNGLTIPNDYFPYTNGIWILNYGNPPTPTVTPTASASPTPSPTAQTCNAIPVDNTGITLPTTGTTECHLIVPAVEIDIQEFTIPLTAWSFPGLYFSTPDVQICVTWADLQIKLFGYDFTILLAAICAMVGVGEFIAVFRS